MPAFELTAPETVPFSAEQYRQAVEVLALMIEDCVAARSVAECLRVAGEASAAED